MNSERLLQAEEEFDALSIADTEIVVEGFIERKGTSSPSS